VAGRLKASAERVQAALEEAGINVQVQELPASTRTAVEAAQAVGCQVGQIAKSLVFRGRETGRGLLVIASGQNRVSEAHVRAWFGEPVELAPPDTVRQLTGFAIGGVPPIGHTTPLPILIDQDLLHYDVIWAAAGTPNAVFRLTPAELLALTQGVPGKID
jgi:prolyl-tRNA editing enzyme YbaK/EbsC (Cys-tRNA(Pro) deacylase)